MTGCKPLSKIEQKAMLDQIASLRNRALLTLGLKTGFRIQELLSLKVEDVFQHGSVVEYVSVARKNMKGKGAGRTVKLHPEARQALQSYLESMTNQPEHWLFRSRKGNNKPLSRFQAFRIIQDAAEAAKVQGPVACHSMRKSFAMGVYERLGKDLVKTQAAMGHQSVESTVKYLSFAQTEIDDAITGD